ncbi:prolyl oligopeptidase family serine peptidase [Gemmatimonas aurantiaca]|uniref:S9 family peptidase n=1 Tax=Gemmatimonas aurantiaca TaxID=173480 RepID=UPI00301BA976
MHRIAIAAIVSLSLSQVSPVGAQEKPTIAQFMSPAYPMNLVTARKADRIAWIANERGMRNVYTAAAPSFTPVRLTSFLKDEGADLSRLSISDDGSTVLFARGTPANRQGWIANPSYNPEGGDYATWTVKTSGGPAWRVVGGDGFVLSPDGRFAVGSREGQLYRISLTYGRPKTAMDTAGVPFVKVWGSNGSPQWSPDGSKIAFVSLRLNHSLIGIYDVRTRTVDYIAPSFDCDASPLWFPDSKRLFFSRRPAVPFGRQAQQGIPGNIGFPAGAAATPLPPNSRGIVDLESGCGPSRGGGFGRPATAGRGAGAANNPLLNSPGLYNSAFAGGYTQSFMIADVANLTAREVWHNQPNDPLFATINGMRLAGDHIVFPVQVPRDEWDRYYSVSLTATGNPAPVRLTTTDGLIEGSTISPDGQSFLYYTNATDIERRHLWSVPVAGGTPKQVTVGQNAETDPAPLASGRHVAYLSYGIALPPSVTVMPTSGGAARVIFPTLPKDFPTAAHVAPEVVVTKAADGLEIHNQVFVPRDVKPGERRPALVFVHGGPPRQMLPLYHYMHPYTLMYAFNQWLASQGYVVISVNYRLGIGYGRSFQNAPGTFSSGNAEYQDVIAAAKYLQSRPDVDPTRIGIYGQSYGGLLTAQALARNSDIFVAGADLAGLHLYTNVLNDSSVAYRSSPISAIDTWKSPVFLWQGDDDRNLDASQTAGLIPLLRARNIYHELIVVPDDMHEASLHRRVLEMYGKTADFLHRFVWLKQTPPTAR